MFPRGAALQTARDLKSEISQDEIMDWAANLSYRFLLALFPFFIFLGAVGGMATRLIGVENPALEMMNRFGGRARYSAPSWTTC